MTALLLAPETVALNCWVAPKPTVELAGEMVTLTFDGGGFDGGGFAELEPPPPHPAAANARRTTAASPSLPVYLIALRSVPLAQLKPASIPSRFGSTYYIGASRRRRQDILDR